MSETRALSILTALALLSGVAFPESGSGPLLALAVLVVARAGLPGLRSPLAALGALVLLASHCAAADGWTSLQALAHWGLLVLAFAAGEGLARLGAARCLAPLFLVLGACWTVHAWWQLLVSHPRLLEAGASADPGLASQLGDGRTNAVFLLPGHLGGMLAAVAILAAAAAVQTWLSGRKPAAIGYGFGLAVVAAGLLAARSIGSALGLGFGLGVLGLLALRGRARVIWVVTGLVASLGIGGLIASSRSQAISVENPATARAANWTAAARLIRERPLLGYGGGAFAHEYTRVRPPGANLTRRAHQAFLEAAAEHGLVILPLLAALLATLARRHWRAAIGTGGRVADRWGRAGPAAAASALLAHGLWDFGWSRPEWAGLAALLLGYSAVAASTPAPLERRRLDLAVAALIGLAVLGVGELARLESRRSEAVRALAVDGDHRQAASAAGALRERLPWSSATWALEAEARLAAGDPLGIVGLCEQAIRRSPRRPSLHALHARALLAEGRRLEAWLAAERAAALGPTVPQWTELRDRLRPPAPQPAP